MRFTVTWPMAEKTSATKAESMAMGAPCARDERGFTTEHTEGTRRAHDVSVLSVCSVVNPIARPRRSRLLRIRRDRHALAAAAGVGLVGVREDELGVQRRRLIVDLRPEEEQHRLGVD